MKWESLTVGQYQELYRLSLKSNLDDFEKVEKAICIIYNLSESQVEDMLRTEFIEKAKHISFLFSKESIPGKAKNYINCGRKKYKVNYDVTKLSHGQWVSIAHFMDKPIENMHFILACMVNPVKFGITLKNKSADHIKYSEDLLSARMIDVYHSCVFFCKVYTNSIEAIRDYLEAQMIAKGKTKEEAAMLLNLSISAMDGFIQQKSWPILSESV